MFTKILVANRGEIAVRAFRAATELGAKTVAVFPHEDRNSEHRLKADESYQIGEPGHPVRAYLDHENIVRVAVECGADAVYPGYGFLSENPLLAEACEANGIAFIGPPASVLHLTGNKARAITAARAAGLPTLASADATADLDALAAAAEGIGFPVFVKAVSGGGGRGMRRVDDPSTLRESLEAAQREADACEHRLRDEIALVPPQALVALGATAARQLLGREVAVTRERGRWLQRDDGRLVLITLHPSALLRAPAEEREQAFADWLADLGKATPWARGASADPTRGPGA